MERRILAFICVVLLAGALFGCSENDAEPLEKQTEKTVVTIMHYTRLDALEELVESTYDDIDLQSERTAISTLSDDTERRLLSGRGTDLIITTQPASSDAVSHVLDLSGFPFSTHYESTMIDTLSVEDHVYYLPLPGQYYGYIINKTLFDEAGIALPETNEAFLQALLTMKKQGIGIGEDGTNFGIQMMEYVSFGTYLTGCMVPDFLSTPEGVKWLSDFEEKKATFTGTWESSFSLYEQLAENGLFNSMVASQQTNALPVEHRMGNGTLTAVYGSSTMITLCESENKQAMQVDGVPQYEYCMLPFFSATGRPPWTVTAPSVYIGINAALSAPENLAKQEACLRILDLVSTPVGQQALIDDTRTDISYLKDCQIVPTNQRTGLEQCSENGYIYAVKFPGKVIEYLGKNAFDVVGGKKTIAQCLSAVDAYYRDGSAKEVYDQTIVGAAADDFIYQGYNTRLEETAIGNLVTDSVQELTGAPIALVNGGAIRASLYQGDIRGGDLIAVCPYDNTIIVMEIPGDILWQTLENGVSQHKEAEDIPGGRFLQASGIRYRFNSTKEAGERLISVSLADGTPILPEQRYCVAVNDYMAGSKGYLDNNGDGYTMLNLFSDTAAKSDRVKLVRAYSETYCDALKLYLKNHSNAPIEPKLEGRIINEKQSLGEQNENDA